MPRGPYHYTHWELFSSIASISLALGQLTFQPTPNTSRTDLCKATRMDRRMLEASRRAPQLVDWTFSIHLALFSVSNAIGHAWCIQIQFLINTATGWACWGSVSRERPDRSKPGWNRAHGHFSLSLFPSFLSNSHYTNAVQQKKQQKCLNKKVKSFKIEWLVFKAWQCSRDTILTDNQMSSSVERGMSIRARFTMNAFGQRKQEQRQRYTVSLLGMEEILSRTLTGIWALERSEMFVLLQSVAVWARWKFKNHQYGSIDGARS